MQTYARPCVCVRARVRACVCNFHVPNFLLFFLPWRRLCFVFYCVTLPILVKNSVILKEHRPEGIVVLDYHKRKVYEKRIETNSLTISTFPFTPYLPFCTTLFLAFPLSTLRPKYSYINIFFHTIKRLYFQKVTAVWRGSRRMISYIKEIIIMCKQKLSSIVFELEYHQ